MRLPPGVDLSDPAAAMPWWQYLCLDVYMAVVAVLLLVMGGVFVAARAVWRDVRWRPPIRLSSSAGAVKMD